MKSKLKVALSKVSHLPVLQKIAQRQPAPVPDPKAIAGRFYLKVLPRMSTVPKVMSAAPKVNLWLWLIGYLRIHWPQLEGKATSRFIPRKKLRLLLRELQKYLPAQKLAPIRSQNPGVLKPGTAETSLVQRQKKKELH